MASRPIPLFLRSFQTSSSGLSSGEYGLTVFALSSVVSLGCTKCIRDRCESGLFVGADYCDDDVWRPDGEGGFYRECNDYGHCALWILFSRPVLEVASSVGSPAGNEYESELLSERFQEPVWVCVAEEVPADVSRAVAEPLPLETVSAGGAG